MAYKITCDLCGKDPNEEIICRRCYDELKDELDNALMQLENAEREIEELKEN